MLRKSLLTLTCFVALSVTAFGARFTTAFDPLETRLTNLQNALPDTLDKSQKKAAKTYRSVLKKLSKDTTSLQAELKLGKSVVGKLSKLGDTDVDTDVEDALDDLRGRVLALLQGADSRSNTIPGKSFTQMAKQIDAGFAAMESAAQQDSQKKRLALYAKAEARARKAGKIADKVRCPGFAPDPGDTVAITLDGAPFRVDNVAAYVASNGFGSNTTIVFYDCESERALTISLPVPLTEGSYFGGSLNPATNAGAVFGPSGPGFGLFTFQTEVTVTSVDDAGRLQFTFEIDFGTQGTDFDGVFLGTIDIPSIQ